MELNRTEREQPGTSLQFLVSENDWAGVEAFLDQASPAETSRELSEMDKTHKAVLLERLGPEKSTFSAPCLSV